MQRNTLIAVLAVAIVAVAIAAAAFILLSGNNDKPDAPTDVTITVSGVDIEVGEEAEIKYTVTPSSYASRAVVTPANTTVYSYANGKVTGLSKGTSTITVSVGDVIKTADVKVSGIKVTDHNGKVVELDKPAERVVVYTKYMAEAFILMGATDKVVATSDTVIKDSNYAKYYAGKASVGSSTPSSADIAIQNNADLVILYSGDASIYSASGIPVLEIGASKLNEIHADVVALGKALGMRDQADKILSWFDKYYGLVTSKASTSDASKKFAIESWSASKLSMCGDTSTPGTLLKSVGGSNVFTGGYNYPEASTLIELNPDIYATVMYNAQWTEADIQNQFDAIASRPGWDQINAVKNGEIYNVSNDIIGGIRGVIGGMFFLSLINESCKDYSVKQIMGEYNAIAGTSFNDELVVRYGGAPDISITVSDLTIEAGESAELAYTVTPGSYASKAVVTPTNNTVYSYADGKVTGLSKGTSTITVSVGDVSKTVNVNVTGIAVTDHNGKVVTLDKPAERVVVYTKYMAEAFILMGATDKVVATSDTVIKDSNYAKYYAGKASVGSSTPSSADVAIQNNADLVILYSGDASIYNASGIPVLEIGASKLNEIHADVVALGKALGMREQADKVLSWFDKYYGLVTSKASTSDASKKFALESWSASKLSMCGDTSTPGTLLKSVGGSNVFTGGYNYPEASTLVGLNPDVYVTVMYNAQWTDSDIQNQFDAVKTRAGWDQIDAVKNKEVYNVSNDIIGGIRGVIGGMFFLSLINESCKDYSVKEIMGEYNALAGTSFNDELVYKMS